MAIMMAGGFTWGDATTAGEQKSAGNNDEEGDQETFHVFQIGLLGLNETKLFLVLEKVQRYGEIK
jgi:hypothetical protein